MSVFDWINHNRKTWPDLCIVPYQLECNEWAGSWQRHGHHPHCSSTQKRTGPVSMVTIVVKHQPYISFIPQHPET